MKTYKTHISGWVPVALAQRLSELAAEKGDTLSQLIADTLSVLAFGKPLDRVPASRGNNGNKDGKDEVAEALIRANMDKSSRELEELCKANGAGRGKDWCAKRKKQFATASKLRSE